MGRITAVRRVTRRTVGRAPYGCGDSLAVEEPLEIRIAGRPLSVTMRTPGHDVELAAGFLVSEGVVRRPDDFRNARFCAGVSSADGETNSYNVIDVTLAPGVAVPQAGLERTSYTTSACGVCGKSSIDAIRTRSAFSVSDDPSRVSDHVLVQLPDQLRDGQAAFDKTGGLHAAGLFDASTGDMLVLREDVGRHNAVDKVVGWALTSGALPARGCVLMVSGRASFELTQKALMAGIPVLAAVSAPSTLAVDLANEVGMTLVGFLRGESMVVYSGGHRIESASAERGGVA